MTTARPSRVGEQIARYLSARAIPALRDPRLGFTTVTGVVISPDLRSARVFVTVLDEDPAKRTLALGALNGAAGRFRSELGRDLSLRHVPTLQFLEDESVGRGDRIERLIQEIRSGPHFQDEDERESAPGGDMGEDEDEDESE